uniref:(California timema) hypothetical protein n=1 Tax=Timema californicum TaxID=61474 RepID=A0A7R9P507_TIMCA|nr:unnamed protein product [Timema californicum]
MAWMGKESSHLGLRAVPRPVTHYSKHPLPSTIFPPSLTVLCLQELCCRAIVARTTVYGIDQLPLPTSIKSHLKSYAMTNTSNQHRYVLNHISNRGSVGGRLAQHKKLRFVGGVSSTGMMSPSPSSGSPTGVDSSRTSCTGRNSCVMS